LEDVIKREVNGDMEDLSLDILIGNGEGD